MIYLASPYTHPDPAVRHKRYLAAAACAAHFVSKGYPLFSPIAYDHPMLELAPKLRDWSDAEWYRLSSEWLAASASMWVLCLPGWRESVGVQREIRQAERMVVRWLTADWTFVERAPEEDAP